MDVEATPLTDFCHDDLRLRRDHPVQLDSHLANELALKGLVRLSSPSMPPNVSRIAARWHGATVVCIASGPSLTQKDCEAVATWRAAAPNMRKAIVVGTSFRMAPWADVIYACDGRWWGRYGEEAKRMSTGEWWVGEAVSARQYGLQAVQVSEDPGLCMKPGRINSGRNSGYQSIGMAFMWGATRIVLLGFEFQNTGGKSHWFGDHEGTLPNPDPTKFAEWADRMIPLQMDLRAQGVEVLNASRVSTIKCFQRVPLAAALGGNHAKAA